MCRLFTLKNHTLHVKPVKLFDQQQRSLFQYQAEKSSLLFVYIYIYFYFSLFVFWLFLS
jgi:hypothetical protein